MHCHHVNLQGKGFGGGEIYVRALARALAEAGAKVTLYVAHDNPIWHGLESSAIELIQVENVSQIEERMRYQRPTWIAFHTLAPTPVVEALREGGHFVTAFAHMPLIDRDARPLRSFDLVFGVSRYVISTLHSNGIERTYAEPLYGVAGIDPARTLRSGQPLIARSVYDWDRRKVRDRALAAVEPLARRFLAQRKFERAAGLTLGIVSLLSPIKQFPLLFVTVAPVLARQSSVHLEIFGHGGYAQVRDLRHALAPLGNRVRFWGHQEAVADIYPQLDYLLTGLAEKEALGLNVLEAQACGTPVLAPDAPPFTETVLEGKSGYRYRDPRTDGGADFALLIQDIVAGTRPRPDPRVAAAEHLASFSFEALIGRAKRLLAHIEERVSRTPL